MRPSIITAAKGRDKRRGAAIAPKLSPHREATKGFDAEGAKKGLKSIFNRKSHKTWDGDG